MVSKMESTRGVLEPKFLAAIPFLGSKMGSKMVSSTLKKTFKNIKKTIVETIAFQEKNDEEICAPKK